MNNTKIVGAVRDALQSGFNMPDSVIIMLSGILSDADLLGVSVDSGLIEFLSFLLVERISLPIPVDNLRSEWYRKTRSIDFDSLIDNLERIHIISSKIVGNTVMVISTEMLDDILFDFRNIIGNRNAFVDTEMGIFGKVPKELSMVYSDAYSKLKEMNIELTSESYSELEGNKVFNVVLSQTSNYSVNDTQLQEMANMYFNSLPCIESVEVLIDGKSEMYLGISFNESKSGLNRVSESLNAFVKELEYNHVLS